MLHFFFFFYQFSFLPVIISTCVKQWRGTRDCLSYKWNTFSSGYYNVDTTTKFLLCFIHSLFPKHDCFFHPCQRRLGTFFTASLNSHLRLFETKPEASVLKLETNSICINELCNCLL